MTMKEILAITSANPASAASVVFGVHLSAQSVFRLDKTEVRSAYSFLRYSTR